jgi:hypothetical protein
MVEPNEPIICFDCWSEHKFSAFDMELIEVRKQNVDDDKHCLWCQRLLEDRS